MGWDDKEVVNDDKGVVRRWDGDGMGMVGRRRMIKNVVNTVF